MAESTTIWLIRHGEADGMKGRCCGWSDAPLSSQGIEQAKQVAKKLAGESIAKMYSSNLERAFKTAQIVAEPHRLPVEQIQGLAEMHFGDLEGMTYEEAEQRFPAVYQSWMTQPTETQFPNGEHFQQMKMRVLRTFDSVVQRHSGESIGIVAHAGVNRVVLSRAMSIPESEMFQLPQPHCAVNRVSVIPLLAEEGWMRGQ